MGENIRGRVPVLLTNGQRNDSCKDQNEVHDHKYGLQFAHNLCQSRGDDRVAGYCGQEDTVNSAVCWSPVPISGDDNHREKLKREPIINQSTNIISLRAYYSYP